MGLLGILSIAIAVFFAIHAVRTGRNMFWLMVLLMVPFLGSVVYFFAEYLPELRHSGTGRRSARAVKAIVDPNRELREAQLAFERTPTVDNRSRLAEALLARGDVDAAIEHYAACASGPYAKDAKFRRGLARAQIAGGRHADAARTLQALIDDDPREAQGEPSLWLAQTLAESGDDTGALAAYERAHAAFDTTETRCAYGLFLVRLGRDAQARTLLESVVRDSHTGTSYSRAANRDAIEQARAALKTLEARGA